MAPQGSRVLCKTAKLHLYQIIFVQTPLFIYLPLLVRFQPFSACFYFIIKANPALQ
jgi:hypothetical protein